MANTPTSHSAWNEQAWSTEALAALLSPRAFMTRMHDRSSEVKGFKGQTLTIGEFAELVANPLGDNGEVSPQHPAAATKTLTINRAYESTMDFRDDYDLQVKYGKSGWGKYLGEALRKEMEEYFLSLETSIGSSYLRNIAGDITEAEMLTLKQKTIENKWPAGNHHLLVSAAQMAAMLADDVFKESTFVGPDNLFMRTGKVSAFLGFEFLSTDLVRRRDVSGTTRTINIAWRGGENGAFVKGVQQDVKMKKIEVDVAQRVIAWDLYGGALQRGELTWVMRTTNA